MRFLGVSAHTSFPVLVGWRRSMGKGVVRWLGAFVLTVSIFAAGVAPGMAFSPPPAGDGDTPTLPPGAQPPEQNDELEAMLLARDQAFIAGRLPGDNQLSLEQAGGPPRPVA